MGNQDKNYSEWVRVSKIMFFRPFLPSFSISNSRLLVHGVIVSMFSGGRLITGVIGHKLDENWPHLIANLLYANGLQARRQGECAGIPLRAKKVNLMGS